jgi:hypothetical protein
MAHIVAGLEIRPVGCVIENFHGDAGKPDLLIINNSKNIGYPGDLPECGVRSITAIVDFEEGEIDYTSSTYQMDGSYWVPFTGCNGYIKAFDPVNKKFDLVISGPGLRTASNSYDIARPITYQVFKDVTLNDAPNYHLEL